MGAGHRAARRARARRRTTSTGETYFLPSAVMIETRVAARRARERDAVCRTGPNGWAPESRPSADETIDDEVSARARGWVMGDE